MTSCLRSRLITTSKPPHDEARSTRQRPNWYGNSRVAGLAWVRRTVLASLLMCLPMLGAAGCVVDHAWSQVYEEVPLPASVTASHTPKLYLVRRGAGDGKEPIDEIHLLLGEEEWRVAVDSLRYRSSAHKYVVEHFQDTRLLSSGETSPIVLDRSKGILRSFPRVRGTPSGR